MESLTIHPMVVGMQWRLPGRRDQCEPPFVDADLWIVGIALLHHRGQRHSDVVGILRLWLPSPAELPDLAVFQ